MDNLADDDVTRLSGKMEELSGVLLQKYGYSKAKADTEIDNWVKEAEKSYTPSPKPRPGVPPN